MARARRRETQRFSRRPRTRIMRRPVPGIAGRSAKSIADRTGAATAPHETTARPRALGSGSTIGHRIGHTIGVGAGVATVTMKTVARGIAASSAKRCARTTASSREGRVMAARWDCFPSETIGKSPASSSYRRAASAGAVSRGPRKHPTGKANTRRASLRQAEKRVFARSAEGGVACADTARRRPSRPPRRSSASCLGGMASVAFRVVLGVARLPRRRSGRDRGRRHAGGTDIGHLCGPFTTRAERQRRSDVHGVLSAPWAPIALTVPVVATASKMLRRSRVDRAIRSKRSLCPESPSSFHSGQNLSNQINKSLRLYVPE
jgi:hypothetical protein